MVQLYAIDRREAESHLEFNEKGFGVFAALSLAYPGDVFDDPGYNGAVAAYTANPSRFDRPHDTLRKCSAGNRPGRCTAFHPGNQWGGECDSTAVTFSGR